MKGHLMFSTADFSTVHLQILAGSQAVGVYRCLPEFTNFEELDLLLFSLWSPARFLPSALWNSSRSSLVLLPKC